LSDQKLGFVDFAWLFTLGAFPAVFFAAKGAGFQVREIAAGPGELILEFERNPGAPAKT
jgi:hypothetical protein